MALTRRAFVQVVSAGILITVADQVSAQPGRGPVDPRLFVRLYINEDGTITALSGKVEEGQGPRTELTQAAAEELRVSVDRVRLVMSDTQLVPDDGITAGSRTTPSNVPDMRKAAATARELLTEHAARQWQVEPRTLAVQDGVISNSATGQTMTYADLAKSKEIVAAFAGNVREAVALASPDEWKVLGKPIPKLGSRPLVTGDHRYPCDIVRPNMLYGAVLRAPSFGASLVSIDLSPVRAMKDVVIVQEAEFVGFAAPTSFRAGQAVEVATKTASWKQDPSPVSEKTVHAHLKKHAKGSDGRGNSVGSVDKGLAEAAKVLSATYTLAYIQHAPMEPRSAVAEWNDGKLTVWASCDGPFRARRDLAEQFNLDPSQVRVIIPDIGGGFGGKHTAEAALEAARIAKAAGRPVSLRWTRAEEFTWAYCRPAAVIECKAGLDQNGSLVAWDFVNINGGGAALATPYRVANVNHSSQASDSPLRQGSYRCLAATGNNFARESFMDELADQAGVDPLAFRLAHLENPRLRRVLETAARRFNWAERRKKVSSEIGVGLACGTEKNSVVAACAEVAVDRKQNEIRVREVCEVFECGPILNPPNLLSQVQGCIIMGLGGALTEELEFENGALRNASFSKYRVPRFSDVPKLDVELLDNRDIPSAGGGETPIIAVAPAIGNAVFAATGVRLRSMPMRLET